MAAYSDHPTQLLADLTGGRQAAAAELAPLIYDDLRSIAERYLRGESPDHTLQPTALVHEAFLHLIDQSRVEWQGRTHFKAVGATAMRRLLIDHARAKRAQKRGGDFQRVTLADLINPSQESSVDLIILDEALEKLSHLDERQYRVVELRFLGGLTEQEVADVLSVSRTTVQSEWRMAKAWLSGELRKAGLQ